MIDLRYLVKVRFGFKMPSIVSTARFYLNSVNYAVATKGNQVIRSISAKSKNHGSDSTLNVLFFIIFALFVIVILYLIFLMCYAIWNLSKT
jgi:hypothetical protein